MASNQVTVNVNLFAAAIATAIEQASNTSTTLELENTTSSTAAPSSSTAQNTPQRSSGYSS